MKISINCKRKSKQDLKASTLIDIRQADRQHGHVSCALLRVCAHTILHNESRIFARTERRDEAEKS